MHQDFEIFKEEVWEHYRGHARTMPWREPEPNGNFDPYKILVSELMLQQTQVNRVYPKFEAFIKRFPTVDALASASLGEVLTVWSGLGYNRRAKFLHQAAQAVVRQGSFPETLKSLVQLPGVGKNTAGAILAYAFNQPIVFIETNIRTVFIHYFFKDKDDVSDKDIARLVQQALDHENPREFYWALMDYGAFLKSKHGNLSRQSKIYSKQSAFQGSQRQIRGRVIKLLIEQPHQLDDLKKLIDDERLNDVLDDLVREGLIKKRAAQFLLA